MLKFLLVFLSYSSLVYFRRIFFLFSSEISTELNYSKNDYGSIVSLFSFCYTVSKLLLGSLNDIIAPSKALATSVVAVSAVLMGLSTATSINQLLIWVPLTALFQGGAWLAAVNFLKQNYSSEKFTILFTIMSCANNFSGMLAPFIRANNWRDLCFKCGIYGIGLGALVYLYLPKNYHPTLTSNKKLNLNKSQCKEILLSPVIWKISIFLFFAIEIRAIFEMWSPVYITETSTVSFKECTFFFEIGGAVGGLMSGFIVQYLQKYFGKDEARWNVSCLSTGIMFISSSIFYTPTASHVFNSFIIGATTYSCINLYGMMSSECAPIHMSASVSACVSFLSNLGPIIIGTPLAFLIQRYGFICLPTLLQFQTFTFISLLFVTKNIPLHYKEKDA